MYIFSFINIIIQNNNITQNKFKKMESSPNIQNKETEENEDLRQAFDLFDLKENGKINPSEIKETMKQLGFDTKNPTIFKIIEDLDSEESKSNGGISFPEFAEIMKNRLGDRNSKEGVRRIFDLFVDDENAEYIPLESLKKIAKELGERMSEDDLKEMIECATKNEGKLFFDDFYYIISKK